MAVIFSIFLTILVIVAIPFILRFIKDTRKKLQYKNTYAIINVNSGKALRVYNADYSDNVPLVTYTPHNWECITWQIIHLKNGCNLLKNLYTHKTFIPTENPKEGTQFYQITLGESDYQYWVMEKQEENIYRFRLNETDLYLTATENEDNSRPTLQSKKNNNTQLWRLHSQNPIL